MTRDELRAAVARNAHVTFSGAELVEFAALVELELGLSQPTKYLHAAESVQRVEGSQWRVTLTGKRGSAVLSMVDPR